MTLQTKKQAIIENLRKMGKGNFRFVAQTTVDALKKSRITKQPTPSRLVTITKLIFKTMTFGADYETEVNRQRELEGKSADFQSQGTYCVPLTAIKDDGLITKCKNFILDLFGFEIPETLSKVIYKHKEKDQLYVRVYPSLCTSVEEVLIIYDAEGNEISKEEWKKLQEEYFPLKGDNKSQGLEKQIIVLNYKLENVLFIDDGVLNELTGATLSKITARL
jgi:hypothetical protein